MIKEDFVKHLQEIERDFTKVVNENKRLKAENAKLKSEHYKDEELARLQTQVKSLTRQSGHYGLSDAEYKEMMDWWEKHRLTHKHIPKDNTVKLIKGSASIPMPTYYFEIHETSVMTCCCIRCSCGAEHNIYW